MRQIWSRFTRDARGATAVEYAILIGCISIVIVGALGLMREPIMAAWNEAAQLLAGG